MVAFLASILATVILCAIAVAVARRRQPGTPLTWGEAFVASVFVFAIMLLIYGIVPNQWLLWADNELNWRKDQIGIPTGPIPDSWVKNPLFADGITFFGRGRIIVSKETIRDIIAAAIYGVALVGNFLAWLWWQNRGKKAAAKPELTSAYGRPLVRAGATGTGKA